MKLSHWITPSLMVTSLLLVACGDDDNNKRVNSSPSATGASITTQADTSTTGQLTGSDRDGDALTFAVASLPTQGTLSLNADGSFTYVPATEVTGADQFTFIVSDGKSASGVATVNISIEPLPVQFSSYSRAAFNQAESDQPLPLNSRIVNQDLDDETAYDDLLVPSE